MPRNKKSLPEKGIEKLISKFRINGKDFVFLGRLSGLEEDPRVRLTHSADDTNFRNFWVYLKDKMNLQEILRMLEKAGFPDPIYKSQDPVKVIYSDSGREYSLNFKQPEE